MKRLQLKWSEIRPEYKHLPAQHLRDQAAALVRRGFKIPEQPSNDTDSTVHEAIAGETEVDQDLESKIIEGVAKNSNSTRKIKIHYKQNIPQATINKMNTILKKNIPEECDLWTVNQFVYAAAVSTSTKRPPTRYITTLNNRARKLGDKIRICRRNASQLESLLTYITSNRKFTTNILKIARRIKKQHHTLNKDILMELKATALDKIRSLSVAKRHVNKAILRFNQNKRFEEGPAKFLQAKPAEKQMLKLRSVEEYWSKMYEQCAPLNESSRSLELFDSYCRKQLQNNKTPLDAITEADVKQALAGKPNFSAPGPDTINNYWWKKLTCVHRHLARIFNDYLAQRRAIPEWICEGRTILIYKKGEPQLPGNYRPITCLNTIYKAFTSILMKLILRTIAPVWDDIHEQRGAKSGVAGVRDNLLIDTSICQDAVTYKRNLSMAWVDYQKAFDSSSHKFILILLRTMNVHPEIIKVIEQLFNLWRTKVTLREEREETATRFISYKRGIFQGDSLSPMLFCITMLPLSVLLRTFPGYMAGASNNRIHKHTHLFYIDDLKLYAKNEKDLQTMLKAVQEYSSDIGMNLGSEKCAIYHLHRGKGAQEGEDIQLVDGTIVKHLQPQQSYTYLGMQQRDMCQVKDVIANLKEKYFALLKKIWSSELNAKNKIAATNALAVPILSHTFGAIKWTVDDIMQLDRSTRKIMTEFRSHHPRASVQRVYISRRRGGRGLTNIEYLYYRRVISSACFIYNTTDPLLAFVRQHEQMGRGAFLFAAAERSSQVLDSPIQLHGKKQRNPQLELTQKELKEHLRKIAEDKLIRDHREKPMHGLFYRNLEQKKLSPSLTFGFMRATRLYSETEGFVVACQDGVYNTLVYKKNILGLPVDDVRCRVCRGAPETIMHLLSACTKYAPTLYLYRHNAALRVLYYHLRFIFGIDQAKIPAYDSSRVQTVVENEQCKIMWDFPFSTTRQVSANRPDMVLFDHAEREMYVIEMSCPCEENILSKEVEKATKYTDLIFQLKRSYQEFRVTFIPVIVGVLGGISADIIARLQKIKKLRKNDIEHLVNEIQKQVLLGSLRTLRAHEASCPPP